MRPPGGWAPGRVQRCITKHLLGALLWAGHSGGQGETPAAPAPSRGPRRTDTHTFVWDEWCRWRLSEGVAECHPTGVCGGDAESQVRGWGGQHLPPRPGAQPLGGQRGWRGHGQDSSVTQGTWVPGGPGGGRPRGQCSDPGRSACPPRAPSSITRLQEHLLPGTLLTGAFRRNVYFSIYACAIFSPF